MKTKIFKFAVLPLILLVALGFNHWLIWKRDNPPITATDFKVRRILQNARFMQNGPGGEFLSPQQKQTIIDHFWVVTKPLEATLPRPEGDEMDIYIKLPPGQANIFLEPDPAWSCLYIEHWAAEPDEEFPPNNVSDESFNLHPATNRFLRAWLKAGAP